MINQAFAHVEVVGPHVREGYYDLIGPDGDIILPVLWERFIRPGMQVSMRMWPADQLLLQERARQPLTSHNRPSQPTRPLDSQKSPQIQPTRTSSTQHNDRRHHRARRDV